MADLASYGNPERDVEQALVALKKGTQLIKYSRKGKPKFCPFRLSADETTLIWFSRGEERNLKLETISRIIPGQRTAVFRRYLRPEKDYLSFSLLYNSGERSLDLICKDKAEAEVWFAGLKALISTGQHRRSRFDGNRDGRSSYDGGDFISNSPIHSSFGATLEISSSISRNLQTKALIDSLSLPRSDVGSDRANMQLRAGTGDGFRLSVSSAPSCSSHGSGPDDCESLGDVYVWGEIWSDGCLAEGALNPSCSKTDVLLPKPLESNVVLDVHQIACGFRHAALVTRQGEVFSWGEESGGRLGHGVDADVSRPQLVESLALYSVEYVACGEYHTCAVSAAGDVYTWGDGLHSAGLLGHGTDVSHWIPKRVSGPLEGLQVSSVACGSWHSALATSNGKLFTFGDGTFGALGHGDRESIVYPREVESLSGLKTMKVACGVWHTAAIIEVMGHSGTNHLSRKLFTWGDGDKNRLGHGDKEARLVPTCIPSIIDYNFHQLACGHNITVALTTSGHVFTMGSSGNGQLGNPQSDGRVPCFVQDRLAGELVEEIACGSHHVAVLTSRNEVFTWGKGANGRLGHGDVEDRRTPTVVEALKDKHVKSISCGSNFSASICLHKWVSGADQSFCSGCRQAFGFTRKRHNCYNCGLVHCHACSSKKALKAALAPTPGKPHRVCDSCYTKLKASEAGAGIAGNRKNTVARLSVDSRERFERGEIRSSKILLPSNMESVKYLEAKTVKNGKNSDSLSLVVSSQVPSSIPLKDIRFPATIPSHLINLKPVLTSVRLPVGSSRPVSPFSRRPSPPSSAIPFSTMGGFGFSRHIVDGLTKANERRDQEVQKLQAQVKSLRQRCEAQDEALHNSEKKTQEAASLAAKQSAKCGAAIEVIRFLATQMKDMAEKLPPEVDDGASSRALDIPNIGELSDIHQLSTLNANEIEALLETNGRCTSEPSSSLQMDCSESDQRSSLDNPLLINEMATNMQDERMNDHSEVAQGTDLLLQNAGEGSSENRSRSVPPNSDDSSSHLTVENGFASPRISQPSSNNRGESREEFEPGVYITYIQLWNGKKVFLRVKFSRRRFDKWQAETWWNENSHRVFEKYQYRGPEVAPTGPSTNEEHTEEDDGASTSQA